MPNWKELRRNSRVNGSVGSLRCEWWCSDVIHNAPGYELKVVDLGEIQIDQYATSKLRHYFLQKIEGESVMIADGTAGQFDSNYPEGFYGSINDAPDSLRLIYLKEGIDVK